MVVAIQPIDRSVSNLALELDQESQRIILPNITWQQYETLLTTIGDRSGLRLTYLDGMLEIFMPSHLHEMLKTVIARLLERYADEMDILLHGYGSTTFHKELKAKGLEPDECYSIDILKEVPDIALEINLTSGGLDKLAIYKGLGVPEVLVWKNKSLILYDLRADSPKIINRSQFLPQLDLKILAQHIDPNNQPQSVKNFVKAIHSSG